FEQRRLSHLQLTLASDGMARFPLVYNSKNLGECPRFAFLNLGLGVASLFLLLGRDPRLSSELADSLRSNGKTSHPSTTQKTRRVPQVRFLNLGLGVGRVARILSGKRSDAEGAPGSLSEPGSLGCFSLIARSYFYKSIASS